MAEMVAAVVEEPDTGPPGDLVRNPGSDPGPEVVFVRVVEPLADDDPVGHQTPDVSSSSSDESPSPEPPVSDPPRQSPLTVPLALALLPRPPDSRS